MCCVGIVSIHGFGTGRARRLGGGSRFPPLPVVHDEDNDVIRCGRDAAWSCCGVRKTIARYFGRAGYRTLDVRENYTTDFRSDRCITYDHSVLLEDGMASLLRHLALLGNEVALSAVPLFSTSHMFSYNHDQTEPAWLVRKRGFIRIY